MNRRFFIRGLAAAIPAGAVATQIEAETDPVRAALLALSVALEDRFEPGWQAYVSVSEGRPFLNIASDGRMQHVFA